MSNFFLVRYFVVLSFVSHSSMYLFHISLALLVGFLLFLCVILVVVFCPVARYITLYKYFKIRGTRVIHLSLGMGNNVLYHALGR